MKRGLMGRVILSLVAWLFLLTSLVAPVLAQDAMPASGATPALASLDIGLWPEYDRPGMLVISRGEFAPEVPMPLTVEWRIPADSGAPSAVAAVDPQQGLVNQQNTTRVEGDWLVISFELTTPAFQVEYYAPLTTSGDHRSFVYTYSGDYPVTAFSLEAQVPPTAREFVLDPPAASVTQDSSDGLTYHRIQAVALAQREARSWTVRYLKTGSALTAATPGQPRGAAPTQATALDVAAASTGASNSTAWIFLIAFIALVGVGAGAFWLGRMASGAPASEGGEGRPLYCHVCGAPMPADARFCPKCAAPVRER